MAPTTMPPLMPLRGSATRNWCTVGASVAVDGAWGADWAAGITSAMDGDDGAVVTGVWSIPQYRHRTASLLMNSAQ